LRALEELGGSSPPVRLPASSSAAETRGHPCEPQEAFRIYREQKLVVRKRGGLKRALDTRTPIVIPQGPNQR